MSVLITVLNKEPAIAKLESVLAIKDFSERTARLKNVLMTALAKKWENAILNSENAFVKKVSLERIVLRRPALKTALETDFALKTEFANVGTTL